MKLLYLAILFIVCGCAPNLILKDAVKSDSSINMFGTKPERSFFYNEYLDTSLQLRWQANINGSFNTTSFTAYGNKLFVPDLSGRIYSFDIVTGKKEGELNEKGSISTSILLNDFFLFYVLHKENHAKNYIKKYDYSAGKIIAEYEIEDVIIGEPLILSDAILLSTYSGKILKLDLELSKIWEKDVDGNIYSSAAFYENKIIVNNSSGKLFLIDYNRGEVIRSSNIDAVCESGIITDGKRIYIGANNGDLLCVNINDLKVEWRFNSGYKIDIYPVINGDDLYASNLKGSVFKLNKITGKLSWKIETNGIMNSTPILFKNYLIQPDLDKKVLFINTKNGKIEKEFNFSRRVKASPIYYKDVLFLGTDDGRIYAFE